MLHFQKIETKTAYLVSLWYYFDVCVFLGPAESLFGELCFSGF